MSHHIFYQFHRMGSLISIQQFLLHVYKSQQKGSGKKDAKQSQDSKAKDQNKENVVDADFEEVKEDKDDKDKQKRA